MHRRCLNALTGSTLAVAADLNPTLVAQAVKVVAERSEQGSQRGAGSASEGEPAADPVGAAGARLFARLQATVGEVELLGTPGCRRVQRDTLDLAVLSVGNGVGVRSYGDGGDGPLLVQGNGGFLRNVSAFGDDHLGVAVVGELDQVLFAGFARDGELRRGSCRQIDR